MSKLINEPIQVHLDKNSVLTAFIWRRRLYRVKETLGWYREPANWWDKQAVRHFMRVCAGVIGTGVYDLCRRGDRWSLHRVLD